MLQQHAPCAPPPPKKKLKKKNPINSVCTVWADTDTSATNHVHASSQSDNGFSDGMTPTLVYCKYNAIQALT